MCVEKSHGFLLQASVHDLASGCEGDGGTRRHSEGDGGKGVARESARECASECASEWQRERDDGRNSRKSNLFLSARCHVIYPVENVVAASVMRWAERPPCLSFQ